MSGSNKLQLKHLQLKCVTTCILSLCPSHSALKSSAPPVALQPQDTSLKLGRAACMCRDTDGAEQTRGRTRTRAATLAPQRQSVVALNTTTIRASDYGSPSLTLGNQIVQVSPSTSVLSSLQFLPMFRGRCESHASRAEDSVSVCVFARF